MNIVKHSFQILILCLFCVGLSSCSSSKNLTSDLSDKEAISELKEALKFKTHFDADGGMDVQATNSSAKSLDISSLSVHVEQLKTGKFKSFSLSELGIADQLDPKKIAIFDLSLSEWIETHFGGQEDNYNVSITYDSDKPLDNKEDRNIYYISYQHRDK